MTGLHALALAATCCIIYLSVVAILRTLIETKGWRE